MISFMSRQERAVFAYLCLSPVFHRESVVLYSCDKSLSIWFDQDGWTLILFSINHSLILIFPTFYPALLITCSVNNILVICCFRPISTPLSRKGCSFKLLVHHHQPLWKIQVTLPSFVKKNPMTWNLSLDPWKSK